MLKSIYLVTCFCAFSQEVNFENRVITAVRHGLEKNLEYIEKNYKKMNVDCMFGMVLTAAIMNDAYKNGTHVMDKSTWKIMNKSTTILGKALPVVDVNLKWKYIMDYKIWETNIRYKFDKLYAFSKNPNSIILQNLFHEQLYIENPSTDFCLQDIVNLTINLKPKTCLINSNCWKKYYIWNRYASGYALTHRLLLLQLMKARKCLLNHDAYEFRVRQLCSFIFAEVFNGDYFDILDDMFDLFLEEIVLCGYEGYSEFFKNRWLYYILKTQRISGCFPGTIADDLKTRMRRSMNILDDGCADHTTGLGAAVMSLYYNFIVKQNIKNLE